MPGWHVTEVFTDLGRTVHRPAHARTFTTANAAGYDLLLVDTLDDLTRAPRLHHLVQRHTADRCWTHQDALCGLYGWP